MSEMPQNVMGHPDENKYVWLLHASLSVTMSTSEPKRRKKSQMSLYSTRFGTCAKH